MSDLSTGNAALGQFKFPTRAVSAEKLGIQIYEPLVWMALALCPFQDTILQYSPLKLTAAAFSFVPLICLFLLTAVQSWLRKPFTVNRKILILVVYCAVVCAANLFWIDNGEPTLHSQSLLPYTLLTSLVLFTIFGVNYRPSPWLRAAAYSAFLFTIMGIISGEVLGANAISFLQVTPSLSGRPHGFSTEPGTLSVQIVAIGMITAHFLSRKWQKWTIGVLTCVLLVYSSSKGGLISLMLCSVVLGIAKSRASLRSKVIIAVLLIPFLYVGSLFIVSIFGTLIEANQTTTIATRVSMTIYALITVVHHPFGVGFTGFLPSIPRYLPQAMQFVEGLFPIPLAFFEVREYLYPPQAQADCKTFFFDYLVFFGVPFAIVFFKFVGNLLSRLFRSGCDWLFVGVLFSVLALMTYYSTTYAWTLPILFGISLCEVKRSETSRALTQTNPGLDQAGT